MKAKCGQLMLVSATQQNRARCEQDRKKSVCAPVIIAMMGVVRTA